MILLYSENRAILSSISLAVLKSLDFHLRPAAMSIPFWMHVNFALPEFASRVKLGGIAWLSTANYLALNMFKMDRGLS